MLDEDKTFNGSLVLDLRIEYRVHPLYTVEYFAYHLYYLDVIKHNNELNLTRFSNEHSFYLHVTYIVKIYFKYKRNQIILFVLMGH